MTSHEIILADCVVFGAALLVAHLLANLYPGKTDPASQKTLPVWVVETRRSQRKLMMSIYVIVLSLLPELFARTALEALALAPELVAWLQLEVEHFNAWLLFWGAATLINLIEFRLRAAFKARGRSLPVSPLLAALLRGASLILSAIWIAHYVLGWQSTHLLVSATAMTAMGAFALKGVLGDLLAGVSLHLTQSVLPGEWIQIPSLKVEGEVISANWRETRVRTTGGHIHVVPHGKIANAPYRNMSWPDRVRRHGLRFVVDFANDPADVEAALLEAVATVDRVDAEPKPPKVIIKGFEMLGMQYELRFWTRSYHDRSSLEGAVYRAAWSALRARQIAFVRLDGAARTLIDE